MNMLAKLLSATVFAATVLVPLGAAADSLVKVNASNGAGFARLLPALPTDVPWLAADRRGQPAGAMLATEAPSISAWMLVPKPAKTWPAPAVREAGAVPPFAGM
jgi:hypothetical protein